MARVGQNKNALGEKVLVYGAPKTGKSLLAGKLAEKYNLKWIDVENGSSVLLQLDPEWQERIEVAQIPDTPNSPYAIEALLMIFDGRKGYICDNHGKWNCMQCRNSKEIVEFDVENTPKDTIIVIDSLSQVSDSAINHIAKKAGMDLKADKFEWDQWGMLSAILSRLLGSIQNCKAHVVVISHEQELKQEDGREKLTASGGTTNFGRKIPKFFGTVVRGDLINGKHKFVSMTSDAKNFITGSRIDVDTKSEGLVKIFDTAYSAPKTETLVLSNDDAVVEIPIEKPVEDSKVKVPVGESKAESADAKAEAKNAILDRLKKRNS